MVTPNSPGVGPSGVRPAGSVDPVRGDDLSEGTGHPGAGLPGGVGLTGAGLPGVGRYQWLTWTGVSMLMVDLSINASFLVYCQSTLISLLVYM